MTGDEPRDPFGDERGGPWHHTLRQGEMLWLGLAEQGNIAAALAAMKAMSRFDLESVVLERLYVWHATKPGGVLGIEDWVDPPDS